MIPNEYIEHADKIASKSPCNFKVSCLLIDKKGKIVASGYNHHSNIRVMGQPTVHAEFDALKKVRKPSTNLVAFIYRKNGRIITPCQSCYKILKAYGIMDVFYTAGEIEDKIEIKRMKIGE